MYLFNAKIEDPEKLERMLVGRAPIVKTLVDAQLKHSEGGMPPQFLVVGPRGSGKTHMLRIIYDRLSRNKEFVTFHEIAYMVEDETGIGSYFDLLQRIFEALKRWSNDEQKNNYIIGQVENLKEIHPNDWTKSAENILLDILNGKSLLILIENFDSILKGIDRKNAVQELSKLRDFIQQHNQLSFIATSQSLINSLSDDHNPLYGFFNVIQLKRLTLEESFEYVKKVALSENNDELVQFLETHDGKGHLEAIHQFTKGNHRLLLVFFDFLKAEFRSNLSDVFLKSIDELKPYYDSFIKSLAPQQQKIVQYLCLQRNPQKGADISRNCFLDKNTVSKQLSELQFLGYVSAVNEKGRDKYYEINEPLLRMCIEINEDRNGIIKLFVNFLGQLYTAEQLKEKYLHYNYLERFQPESTRKLYKAEAKIYDMVRSRYLNAWKLDEKDEKRLKMCCEPDEAIKMIKDLSYPKGTEDKKIKQIIELIKLNEWEKVFEAIQKQIAINPFDCDLYSVLAASYRYTGQYEKAIEADNKVIELKPDNEKAWYNLGNSYSEINEHAKAIKSYLKTIELFPNDENAWYNLGCSYNEINECEKAIESYKKAIEINPSDETIWNNLGNSYSEISEHTKAIESYLKAIELNPDNEKAWYNLGCSYSEIKECEKAIESYKKAIEINSGDETIWNNLGNSYSETKEYEKAIESFQRAIEINPRDETIWNNLGNSYSEIKEYKKAIEAYNKAIEINPLDETIWFNMGVVYSVTKEYGKAIETYQKAIEINSGDETIWINLGNVYSEIKDYGKALESYNKAIELFPDDETIWFNMGVVYSITKEYKKAIESYQKAIEINPRDEMIWNNLGYAYNEIREHGKAIESYQKAIELFSGDETVWFNLGILYGIIEEYNQAIKAYQKVVEIKPNDDNAWCNLGVLYSIIKKKGNAIKACQKAIELKPDNESAWNNLGIIYYQQMRLVDAKGAFLNAIKYSIEGETEDIAMYYSNLFEVHLALKETDDALSSIETLFSKPERLAFITKLEDSLVLLVKENSEDAVKKVFYKLLQICEANGVNEKLSALLSNVVFRVLRECQKIKPFRIDMLQHILEELFSGKPEFTYPLRFLNIGIRYFMKGEKEAIYEMSQEERSVFEKFTSAESKS